MRIADCCWALLVWLPTGLAAIPVQVPAKPEVRTVTSGDVASWGFALVLVLALFFLFVWGLRKVGGLSAGGSQLRLVGGLSLGMRERVVLLQAGKKQLILGVTPGRIETLLVLEGEDCLYKEEPSPANWPTDSGFAQKLAQLLKPGTEHGRSDPSRN